MKFLTTLLLFTSAILLFPSPAGAQEAPEVVEKLEKKSESLGLALVAVARKRIGVTTAYDPSYIVLKYPGGDVAEDRGVCTDVVVRAFRSNSVAPRDLQKRVHEDMKGHFSEYPKRWGLKRPDRNIDHRRVPNLMTYFSRLGWKLPASKKAGDYQPGDLVCWDLNDAGLVHIGIVSDRKSRDGTPLILHNIGAGTEESDALFRYTIIGRYRPKPVK